MKNLQAIFPTVTLTAVGAVVLSTASARAGAAPADAFGKCAESSLAQSFRAAAAVFRGKVARAGKNGDVRTFAFKVEEFRKVNARRIVRIDVYQTASFEAWFETGKEYLVYGERPRGEKADPRVARCTRSRPTETAAEDLRQLGRGKSPQ